MNLKKNSPHQWILTESSAHQWVPKHFSQHPKILGFHHHLWYNMTV